MPLKLPKNWSQPLSDLSKSESWLDLNNFLEKEIKEGKVIYPARKHWFRALVECSPKDVKVVILGQDPYHGEGQAHGLAFSVNEDCKHPPSLKNIFKELQSDLDCPPPPTGDLSHWSRQGVLLLNTVLTVEKGKAASHQKKGWESVTQAVLKTINDQCENVVFILWGGPAQKSAAFIDQERHCVLKSVHPSPLSSYRGFFGSRPFSKANKYLKTHGISPISWC
ncbi:MAG: uracil-DNA glycosylase [Bacteriovoracaceae bacterium]|nr:uracil-DNA glycosylase [Bacteriovoracaceae bacterium]